MKLVRGSFGRAALAGLVLGFVRPVHAADDADKVAALPLVVEGELDDHVRADLQRRLSAGLSRGDFEVVEADQVLLLYEGAASCADPDCFKAVAAATSTAHLVRFSIEVDGRDYSVDVQLIDGRNGTIVASAQDTCDTCGVDELGSLVADLASTVRSKLDTQESTPPMLVVDSTPSGAMVLVDGDPVGTTPLEVEVGDGEGDIEIKKPGFISHRQRVVFVEGLRESISVTLEAVESEGAETGGRTKAMRGAGWALLAVGVASVGTGVAFLVLHDRPYQAGCTGDDVDADGDCKFRFTSRGYGIGLTAAGGALLVTGAVLVGLATKKNGKNERVQAQFGPTAVGLRVRF